MDTSRQSDATENGRKRYQKRYQKLYRLEHKRLELVLTSDEHQNAKNCCQTTQEKTLDVYQRSSAGVSQSGIYRTR